MAEPTSTTGSAGLLTLLVVLFGPLAGPYVYIVFGALLGAATALSEQPAATRARGAIYLVRVSFFALLFSAPLAGALSDYPHVSADVAMGGAAFLIGWKLDLLLKQVWSGVKGKLPGGNAE